MKENIYSLYNCKNAEELYIKVKRGDEEVRNLTDFINYLKMERKLEAPIISSNVMLSNYLSKKRYPPGKYALLLNNNNILLKEIRLGIDKEISLDESRSITREALLVNAKSTIIVNREVDDIKPSPGQKISVEGLREHLEFFDIGLLEVFNSKENDHFSFLESGIISERTGTYNDYFRKGLNSEKTRVYKVNDYRDLKIEKFRQVEEGQEFLKYYAERELRGLSMTGDLEKVKDILKVELSEQEKEVFAIMYLDKNNRIIEKENLFEGTLNKSNVYIREIAKKVLNREEDISGIVAVHNHPAGTITPSRADIILTEKLKDTFDYLGIELKDHLIVSREEVASFIDMGMLEYRYSSETEKINNKVDFRSREKEEELEI